MLCQLIQHLILGWFITICWCIFIWRQFRFSLRKNKIIFINTKIDEEILKKYDTIGVFDFSYHIEAAVPFRVRIDFLTFVYCTIYALNIIYGQVTETPSIKVMTKNFSSFVLDFFEQQFRVNKTKIWRKKTNCNWNRSTE